MGFLIANKDSGNFLAADDKHSFTNHLGHALTIEKRAEADTMLKAIRKVDKLNKFVLLQEVE